MVRETEASWWHATPSKICSHSPRVAAEGGMDGPEVVEGDRKIRDQGRDQAQDREILQRAGGRGRVLEA